MLIPAAFLTVGSILLLCIVICLDATPIIVNEIEFKDDWDYKIKPHNVQLLGDSPKFHELPPVSKLVGEKPMNDERKKIERNPKKLGDVVRSRVSCSVCKLGVSLLQSEIVTGTSFEDIRTKFVQLCVAFKVESEPVCTGVFNVFGPEVLPVLKAIKLDPTQICALALGETCGEVEIPLHEWNVTFPEVPKPEIIELPVPQPGLPTFKVLHISDTHYDPDYVPGSPANCQEPLCCRSTSTPPEKDAVIPAGKWGSYYSCDSPKDLIVNMLMSIAEEHPDLDYIIWTGDLPPHDVWNQTKESNLAIIQETVQQMFEIFPNVPIFPALGNHESSPAGNYAPPWMTENDHSISWLYTKMADHWRTWLPASSGNTVLHGGFYSILIREGFRIISLNTNYCHTLSWWLFVNSTDPAQELQWLIYELQMAENKGEKVHLIGHIAPGSSDCMKVWSRNFYSIVERYESTIMGQFYGHSHADEFEVFYDVHENSRPTGVAYLGPSVTTYDNYNPAYRIYYVDANHDNSTWEVIDHETWKTDLDEANKADQMPRWYRLYSAKNAFRMDSLRPKDWAKVIQDLVEDPDLFDEFYKYYYRDSPTRPSCDTTCKLQILCDLKSGRSHFRHHLCRDLELALGR